MSATAQQIRARVRVHRDLPTPALRRALREAAGLSQQEMAEAVGASRAAVGYWENGQRCPRGALLDRYVEALNALQEEA